MNNSVRHTIDDDVLDEAFQWAVTMQSGSVSDQQREQFEYWLDERPENLLAWQQIQVIEQEFATFKETKVGSARNQKKKMSFLLGSLLSLTLGMSSMLTEVLTINFWRADHMTGNAERKVTQLAGGAKLMLNSDSAIAMKQVNNYFEIHLLEGELYVDSSAALLPFKPKVITPRGKFTPTGTKFVVKNRTHTTILQVIEGHVSMQADQQLTQVIAGQGWLLAEDIASPIERAAIKPAGWTKLVIEANNARLGDILDGFSHYRPGLLIYSDDVANLKVSGTFQLKDTENALLVLKGSLPIDVKYMTKWLTQIKLKNK